jgi:hypothetical protein
MRFYVQVKNKPCVRKMSYMRLISWIHPRGSKTICICNWHTAIGLICLTGMRLEIYHLFTLLLSLKNFCQKFIIASQLPILVLSNSLPIVGRIIIFTLGIQLKITMRFDISHHLYRNKCTILTASCGLF